MKNKTNFKNNEYNFRNYNQTVSPQLNELLPFNCLVKGEFALQSELNENKIIN